jgi:cyanophycin synthetase
MPRCWRLRGEESSAEASADVAVVLNVAEDHLGLDDIEDVDDLAVVKRVVADAVHAEKSRIISPP